MTDHTGDYQGRHRADTPITEPAPDDLETSIRIAILDLVNDLADSHPAALPAKIRAHMTKLGHLAQHDPNPPATPDDRWCMWYPLTCYVCALVRTLRPPCDHADELGHRCESVPLVATTDGRMVNIDDAPPAPRWTARWYVACERGDRDTARALWAALPGIMPPEQFRQICAAISQQLGYYVAAWDAAGRPLLVRPWGEDQ